MKQPIYSLIFTVTLGLITLPTNAHAQFFDQEHCDNIRAENTRAAQWQRMADALHTISDRLQSFRNARSDIHTLTISFRNDPSIDPRCPDIALSWMDAKVTYWNSHWGEVRTTTIGYAPGTVDRETFVNDSHAKLFLDFMADKHDMEVVIRP